MHANARLTVHGRMELVRRVVAGGRPVAHVVRELGCSRATGYTWLARWRAEGPAGLADRPSRAHRLPGKTPPAMEARVVALRAARKLGPARIGPLLGMPPSTVHAVLTRHGMHRLAWLDRPTGQLVRRYERARPGELLHVDVKKLGRLRDGGGWRVLGRDSPEHRRARDATRVGYEYVHCAVTAPWTTTPASPTPRSTPTSAARPARRSSAAPRPGSPPSASSTSNGS